MLKKEGDDASLSSFPETAWNTIGNFFEGRYDELRYALITAGFAHGCKSPL